MVVSARVEKIVVLMDCLRFLVEDPKAQLLLLRSCMGVPMLQYVLQTVALVALPSVVPAFKRALRETLEGILGFGGQGFGPHHYALAGLSCSLGGQRILQAADLSAFSFLVSFSRTSRL